MSADRFFVDGLHAVGDVVVLSGGDAHKVVVALRKRTGDTLELCDSGGCAFTATLEIVAGEARAHLEALLTVPGPPRLAITLAQGIPKGAKMDFVVEKAAELGVARIIPFVAERTQGEGAREGKLERWRRLARAAAQQCGRHDVPAIAAPLRWERLLHEFGSVDVAIVPWELAAPVALRDRLPALVANARRALVAIGPEGGLSHAEARSAEAAGAQLVSLGPRVLRTETAGLVACAALLYASGDL